MKRKIIITVIAVALVLSTIALAACTETANEFYASLQADCEEVSGEIANIIQVTKARDYSTSFDYVYNYYNGVTRGNEETGEQGWLDEDADGDGNAEYSWMYRTAHADIVKSGDTIYTKVLMYKEVTDEVYEGKDYTPAVFATGEAWVDANTGVIKSAKATDENGNDIDYTTLTYDVDGYTMQSFMTMWYDLLAEFSDLTDQFADITSAYYGFKIYQNIAQVCKRKVYDRQDNPYPTFHDERGDNQRSFDYNGEKLMSYAYDQDIRYNWELVNKLTETRINISADLKDNMKMLELFSEYVIAYYDQKNEMDKSLVLKAGVWAKSQVVMELDYKNVLAIQ